MTTQRLLRILVFSHLLLLAGGAQAAESVSVRLQKAIFAEEIEGNLEAAIKMYAEIVEETETNKPIAAQAQYRLGICRQKQGKHDEAAAAFRRLVDRFSDAAELVTKSRQRLQELGKPVTPAVVRQIWTGALSDAPTPSGRLSPDGRYISFVDWTTQDLAVKDLRTGRTLRLTANDSGKAGHLHGGVFSPNGQQIAYSRYSPTNESYDLRLVSLNHSEPRVLVKAQTNTWILAEDWSPDGQAIAVVAWKAEGTNWHRSIALISVADGTEREIIQVREQSIADVRFSPDGRFLAYSFFVNRTNTDISLVRIADGKETQLVEHLALDRIVSWSPDGKGLIISSNRRRSTDLWLLPLAEGRADGPLVLLKADLDKVSPIGMTRSGQFYYQVTTTVWALYQASLDVTTGKVISVPKEIPSRFSMSKSVSGKRLSPNGQYLAFSTRRDSQSSFHLEDLATGEIQDINLRGDGNSFYPRWSADSEFFFVPGVSSDDRNGLFLFSRITGQTSVLAQPEPGFKNNYSWFGFENGTARYSIQPVGQQRITLVWHDVRSGAKREQHIDAAPVQGQVTPSSDGQSLFYIEPRHLKSGTTNWVGYRRDVTTGRDLEFLRSDKPFSFTCEPGTDGFGHATHPNLPQVLVSVRPSNDVTIVKGIDLAENTAKERFSVTLPDRARLWPHWFGAQPNLLFLKPASDASQRNVELWAVLTDRNEIRKTDVAMPGLRIVGNYGDNEILLESQVSGTSEIWVMDNFLPLATAAH